MLLLLPLSSLPLSSPVGWRQRGGKEEGERGKREISEEFPLKRDSNFLFCLSQLKPLGGTRRGKFLLPPICKRKEVLTSQQRQLYRLYRPVRRGLSFPPSFLSLSLGPCSNAARTHIHIYTHTKLPNVFEPATQHQARKEQQLCFFLSGRGGGGAARVEAGSPEKRKKERSCRPRSFPLSPFLPFSRKHTSLATPFVLLPNF